MPEPSRFYGIVVRMHFDDDQQHLLPHVHVHYGGMDASYSLRGKLFGGKIPPKQEKLLLAWIDLHERELQETGILEPASCFVVFPAKRSILSAHVPHSLPKRGSFTPTLPRLNEGVPLACF